MSPKKTTLPMSSRGLITEREMEFYPEDGDLDEVICQIVAYHQWSKFVKSPGDFYIKWVLEFYENLKKGADFSMVEGVKIDCSSEKINHLYDVDNVDDRVTEAFMDNPKWAEVEGDTGVFPFGIEWTHDSFGERQSFPGRNIGYAARAIQAFLATRLLPTSGDSQVYSSRALLLSAIYNKKPVNVGRIIATSIQSCKYDTDARSIFFPSTITLLIMDAGLKPAENLHATLCNSMINKSYWKKIETTEGPLKQEGEEERKRQAWRTARPKKKEESAKKKDVDEIKERCGRIEHILMQGLMYHSSVMWQFANMVRERFEREGCSNLPEFFPFFWSDPANTPIPQFLTIEDFTDEQPAYAPPPEAPIPHSDVATADTQEGLGVSYPFSGETFGIADLTPTDVGIVGFLKENDDQFDVNMAGSLQDENGEVSNGK